MSARALLSARVDGTASQYVPVACDASGRLVIAGGGGAVSVIGTKTPADGFANPTDAVGTWALAGGYNGATWDRLRALAPADALANPATGALVSNALLSGWDGVNWYRARMALTDGGDVANNIRTLQVQCMNYGWSGAGWRRQDTVAPADGMATPNGNASVAFNAAYNGASFDRVRSAAPSDALANPANGALLSNALLTGWDGSNWRRARTGAMAGGSVHGLVVAQGDPARGSNVPAPSLYAIGGSTAQQAVISASPARLLAFNCYFVDGTDAGLFFFNKAAAPVNGDTPLLRFPIQPVDADGLTKLRTIGRDVLGPGGTDFSTGLAWAMSSTPDTLTLETPTSLTLNVWYTT